MNICCNNGRTLRKISQQQSYNWDMIGLVKYSALYLMDQVRICKGRRKLFYRFWWLHWPPMCQRLMPPKCLPMLGRNGCAILERSRKRSSLIFEVVYPAARKYSSRTGQYVLTGHFRSDSVFYHARILKSTMVKREYHAPRYDMSEIVPGNRKLSAAGRGEWSDFLFR